MNYFSSWCVVQLLCVILAIFDIATASYLIRQAIRRFGSISKWLLFPSSLAVARIVWLILEMIVPLSCSGDGAVACAFVVVIVFPLVALAASAATMLTITFFIQRSFRWALLGGLLAVGFCLEIVRFGQTIRHWGFYWWWLVH